MTARTAWAPTLIAILFGLQTFCNTSVLPAQEDAGDALPAPSMAVGIDATMLECGKCGERFPCCQLVPCTVMVSEKVTETRIKTCLTTNKEERLETYTAFVPRRKTRTITREHCYLTDKVKTQKITQRQCHVVQLPVARECKSQVVERCQSEDCAEGKGGSCDSKNCAQHPSQCETATIVEQNCSSASCEPTVVIGTTTREIDYCVKEPKTHKCECEETYIELEPVTMTRTVYVTVPRYVSVPEEVTVCRTVPRTVMCCPCCSDTKKK